MTTEIRILRRAEVQRITGLSATTIWRRERDGAFPKRRRLGPRAVGWLASEVLAWAESRVPVATARRSDSSGSDQ